MRKRILCFCLPYFSHGIIKETSDDSVYLKGERTVSDKKKNGSGHLDYILEEYTRKEKKIMENSCITGDDSGKTDDAGYRKQRIGKIISVLTTFSLILGFLVFLFLWLL